MVAVVGDVLALEYNLHVPLYFKGQAVRMRGWLYAPMFFFLLLVCWLSVPLSKFPSIPNPLSPFHLTM
jgi:apolipoprotein N-acyltransferase